MSQPRHRPIRRGKRSSKAGVGARAFAPQRRSKGLVSWFLISLTVLAGGAWLAFHIRSSPARLPEISLTSLDADSRRLIEKHRSEVRQSPRSGTAWGKLGAILRSYNFRAEAVYCFNQAERLDSGDPRWPYLHGLLLIQSSPSNALTQLRRAVELCGNEPDAPRLRLAMMLVEGGRWEEAKDELQALLQSHPDHGLAWMGLARIAQARGDLTKAISLASRCLRDGRAAHSAWTMLAALRLRLGDADGAQQAAQMASTLPPVKGLLDPLEAEAESWRGDPRILSDRAQQFLMAGQTTEASPLVNRLLEEHPDFAETWLLLGRLQVMQQQYLAAEESLKRYVKRNPQSAGGCFQLGMALLRLQRFAEAAKVFEKATQLQPDFGPAFFNLGVCRAQSGQKLEAIAPFREVIRHNPEYIDSYILLADLYGQLGHSLEATPLYEKALALNPQDRRLPILRERIGAP